MLMNFTKSELFRVSRMKSAYVLPIIMIITVMFTSLMYMGVNKNVIGIEEEDLDNVSSSGLTVDDMSDSVELGFNAGSGISEDGTVEGEDEEEDKSFFGEGLWYNRSTDFMFYANVKGLDALLFLSIFVGLFCGAIHNTGMDKNNLLASGHKNTLYAARAITIGLYTLFFHFVTFAATILGVAIFGKSVRFVEGIGFVKYFVLSFILTYAFSMVIMLVGTFLKSQAAAITVGIILAAGVLTVLISFIDLFIKEVLKLEKINLANVTLTQRLSLLNYDSSTASIIRTLLVCAVVFTVVTLVHVFINRKRDLC